MSLKKEETVEIHMTGRRLYVDPVKMLNSEGTLKNINKLKNSSTYKRIVNLHKEKKAVNS